MVKLHINFAIFVPVCSSSNYLQFRQTSKRWKFESIYEAVNMRKEQSYTSRNDVQKSHVSDI